MGSLMAGWDSHVHDHNPKAVMYKRNRSLTRGEIDAYWRSKNKTVEDHLRSISSSPTDSPDTTPRKSKEIIFERSHTFPITERIRELLNTESMDSFEDKNKSNGWWTRSCWAFLNEPPVIEEAPYGCRGGMKSSRTVDSIKQDAEAY